MLLFGCIEADYCVKVGSRLIIQLSKSKVIRYLKLLVMPGALMS